MPTRSASSALDIRQFCWSRATIRWSRSSKSAIRFIFSEINKITDKSTGNWQDSVKKREN